MTRTGLGWILMAATLLASCGTSEKKEDIFKKLAEEGGAKGECPTNYAPIPAFRDGLVPVSLDSLPLGNYEFHNMEMHLRAEDGDRGALIQAHYTEDFRLGGTLVSKVCASALGPRTLVESKFPLFRRMVRGANVLVRPSTYLLLGQNQKFSMSLSQGSSDVESDVAGMLARWTSAKIYQVTTTQYEFRLRSTEVEDGRRVTKSFVMRFTFTPAEP